MSATAVRQELRPPYVRMIDSKVFIIKEVLHVLTHKKKKYFHLVARWHAGTQREPELKSR